MSSKPFGIVIETDAIQCKADVKLLVRVASSRGQDPKLFEELFATDSWQTLMTFTRESARTYNSYVSLEDYPTLMIQ